jgi:hypothetical protein
MAEVTNRMMQIAVASLPGHGFDFDRQKSVCNDLQTRLQRFMELLCHPYEEEINRHLATGRSDHRRDELVSWTISELSGIWHTAIGRFSSRIANHESILLGQQRIGCEQSTHYLPWLVDEAEVAKVERARNRGTLPRSLKAQRKQAKHSWTPYPIDVIFDNIRRVVGRR